MPQQYTYPGVYVEEIPSGVHTITGVATSIAAFIDFFKEGPMDKAVRIQSLSDFNRLFGGLSIKSPASYAINQFFLNGGTEAYVVRTAKAGTFATADIELTDGSSTVLTVSALSPGAWGNTLRVDIDYNTDDPSSLFNLTVTRYVSDEDDAQPLASEQFLNLSMDDTNSRYAEKIINSDSKLITVVVASSGSAMPLPTGLISDDHTVVPTVTSGEKMNVQIGSGTALEVTVTFDGTASFNKLKKAISAGLHSAKNSEGVTPTAFAEATVEVYSDGTNTNFRILSGRKADTYSPIEQITVTANGADTIAADLKLTTGTANVQQYPVGFDGTVPSGAAMVKDSKGADGDEPEAGDIIGSSSEPFTGMYALELADLFNIMCIPRAAIIADDSGAGGVTAMQAIYSKALAYCIKRRAFLIIDIPESVNAVDEMEDWLDANAGLRDKNSAVYFPRLQMPDPLDEYRLKSVGPSGTIGGLYSRIDTSRGVWKAPAGTEASLKGVSALDVDLTDAQNGTLNPLAANCFRTFPIYGTVSWGARTLDGSDQAASEWKYIPIRRLALFLEESLFRGTKWVVFEPNDEPLWSKVRLNINAFMMGLFKQGAFQGGTPDQAFYVKCDGETTTQDDRNKGIVNIEVGFAPLKPAEFVVLKFQQIAGEL